MVTRASGTPWLLDGAENPLAPPSVVAGLQEITPRMGLQYHVGMRAFMVTLRWPEDDPRRQMIRDGQMAPDADFEILCPIPAHVSLDELRPWLETQLTRVGESREDVRRMVADHEARVAKATSAQIERKADEAKHDLIENLTKPSTVGSRRTRVK